MSRSRGLHNAHDIRPVHLAEVCLIHHSPGAACYVMKELPGEANVKAGLQSTKATSSSGLPCVLNAANAHDFDHLPPHHTFQTQFAAPLAKRCSAYSAKEDFWETYACARGCARVCAHSSAK